METAEPEQEVENISYINDGADGAKDALSRRPKVSIRLRVLLGFLVIFVLFCVVTLTGIYFVKKLDKKLRFLENAGNYAFEIQQTRRFEKNYFLYGTDMYDALHHVHSAQHLLDTYKDNYQSIIGEHAFNVMTSSLGRYSELLEKLDDVNQDDSNQEMLHDIESEIRQYGAQIVANASDMIDQERLRVHTWIGSSTIIAVMGLALILLIEVGLATFITRQIIQPFGRFERYTQRIAAGDFSPITPARRYRDEFTNLAIALNRMGKELLEREEQLLQSRKLAAVGTLTAGIAHELNNPLNNISVTTEALIDDLDEFSNDEKLSMLNDINTQTERASHTVANLLDFTHRDTSSFNHLSIKEVLKSAFRLVENEFALNQINLETHFQDNIPKIMGRELNLQQVFVNLFMNAIRAMSEGGTLTVRSRIEDNSVRVDVSDTGVGIAPANLEKIFDPFFTTQDVSKGTGLGLSVSFGIIQRHHGTLSVVSELGEGSTFSVVLPIA